ncbi:MAG TPA: di-heme oxidoredictase family protein [Planctomycetota bacterium]|nr:di-heme oxidoredictase family protein [Planctomycetota bacterium]
MKSAVWILPSFALLAAFASSTYAQQNDQDQYPNPEGAGIRKTLAQEIGAGRGDVNTLDSSLFIIKRDPFRAIRRGRQLFQRKFTIGQGFGPRVGDGSGDFLIGPAPTAGLADSCAACHGRPVGSAGAGGDVFTRPDSRDAPHLFGLGLVEMLADEITSELRAQRDTALNQAISSGRPVTQAMTSKGISYGSIRALPNGTVELSGLDGVDPDLRVKPFFAHGGQFSIRAFAVGAFQDEMGLQAVDPDLTAAAAGGRVVTPAGLILDGAHDAISPPPCVSALVDPDGDGKVNEIPTSLVDYMEFYLLNYFRPATFEETNPVRKGRKVFETIGCAVCHIPDLVIQRDRRVADVSTVFDRQRGVMNQLFATATPLLTASSDGSSFPAIKTPAGNPFVVRGIFADFKRHDLGPAFHERNFDGTIRTKFMTEPLWGVSTTAPYGHDGKSVNLKAVILRHGGEAQAARDAFDHLSDEAEADLLVFLHSLVLFPPDHTASNLDPGNPAAPDYPTRGQGSIRLTALFNDPTDPE